MSWAREKNDLDRAIAQSFGQAFELHAMVKPARGRACPDGSRGMAKFCGVFGSNSNNRSLKTQPDSVETSITVRETWISLARKDIPFDVVQDDLVADPALGEWWSVLDVRPDGQGRIKLLLTQWAGRPGQELR